MKLLDKENLVKIKFLDNHIVVVFKDAFVLTQPNNTKTLDLETLTKNFLKEKFKKPGKVFLHAIHRLDKEVEGLVLFARTSKALKRLNEQMKEKKITRKYIAEVQGHLKEKQSTIENLLIHRSHRAKVVTKDPKAKKSFLKYKVIKEKKDSSILEIELLTGRYHQIRISFASIGHPIIGDKKYGSKIASKKMHLCCFCLEFTHPITKKHLQFKVDNNF